METKYETKTIQSCVFVDYGDGEKGIIMPTDETTMFVHLDGNMVLLNDAENPRKIKEIRPLLFTGYKDINGLDIYDGDIVKFNDTTDGVINWVNDGFYVVADKNLVRLASAHNLIKTGNILLDEKKEEIISDAEVVEEATVTAEEIN